MDRTLLECYNQDMKEIVTGLPIFNQIIEAGDIIYVDKTEYVYRMVKSRDRFFFISRPRRFGKSLMCSTLDALFSGKKELFKDLYIGKTGYDFKPCPVLRFDFSAPSTSKHEGFLNGFRMQLHANALRNKVNIHDAEPAEMMNELLFHLSEPVIIIDEFDSPVIKAVSKGKAELADAIREDLNDFYSVIKSCTGRIRFLFITGCTKLSGLSIFSAMNNLNDISADSYYAGMFGYTEEELADSFSEHIDQKLTLQDCTHKNREEFLSALRSYYDGYRFSPKSEVRVYNPVSIGSYFSGPGASFSNYWMTTGGLSTLAVTLAKHNNLLSIVDEKPELDTQDLAVFDITTLRVPDIPAKSAIALLYYAGYLTIAGANGQDVCLDFPNAEVRSTFLSALIELYGSFPKSAGTIARSAARLAAKGDVDGLVSTLNGYYRAFHSTELKNLKEAGIKILFKALFVIADMKVMTEIPSGLGRLDVMLLTEGHDYIIEFKSDGESSEKALSQIAERHYAWILERESKPLHLIGLDFRTEEHQIASYTHRLYTEN